MANKDLKKPYETAKTDIANLLGWFECELDKERTVIQWGYVATLNKVRQDLIETLSFMSGIDEALIKDGLAESRTDAQTQNPQLKG